ncbi:hypothetical protein KUTeg_016706 [Tegillarca granosa]|uniref:CABIT domain-containing protein n=1 Tax=Tegillarca granosa TaxID=220873 RepID=A0ABQ9EQH6_TEGGR|nr:hypothetical protein KUTeg_016706 [Tegillarca granosa]
MASHVAAGDTIQWSEETFTLREVVTKVGLPTMVKVSEGIYTDNEAETFSYGDLLKLEFVKSIRKVSAKLIGIGDGGSLINIEKTLRNPQKYDKMTKEVLIPLGYKGRVELIKPRRKLYTVGQIMEEFPKNIRTETALFVNDKDPPVHLPPGIHLQVDKIIPNRGIVCKNKKNDVTLYKEQKGKFSIIEDERTYTLEEVVECFQFPQFVRFVDTNFEAVETSNLHEAIENIKQFRGILQLTREVIQNVVVGHHKPLSDGRYKGEPRVRSLALLPLDSISQQMIVFNVPIYCDPEEYQLVMARNFSENVDMSSIEGVLYLEFAKDPKVHLFRTGSEEEQTIDLPERKCK